MAKFSLSECFFSLEGEAQFTGTPTVYARFARCNLKCPLFNNHEKLMTPNGYADLGFDPKAFNSLGELPVIERGCDSQYSVNPAFSHMWRTVSTDDVISELEGLLPRGWVFPSGIPVILSLTGGEPTLLWKSLPELILHDRLRDVRHILVETNCTVPFKDSFLEAIHEWMSLDTRRIWTWSNSPKLSSSGEDRDSAIKPAVALMQSSVLTAFPNRVNQYFKFVVDGSQADIDEVRECMAVYHAAGVPTDTPVWLMPAACTTQQQAQIAQKVAEQCMSEGYLFSYRLQNALWENQIGT